MESLANSLQGVISYAVPMIVLLGLLIFVHELGHFLVAKYYKVRVETFSLGFGPKLFKFKRGDTVYAISAIPLGGYVKMFGDDPSAEVTAEQKAYSFLHKPVGQRIGVVLAGPLMNLFFAIVLFSAVAVLGEQALAPKLGDIDAGTPAYNAGFRSGDTIVSVGDDAIKTWDEFQRTIESSGDKPLTVQVARAEGGNATPVRVTPKLARNKNVMSWDRMVGEVEGLTYSSKAAVIGVRDAGSIAALAGLKTGDMVQGVNGNKITRWREFHEALEKNKSAETLSLDVERGILDDGNKDGTTRSQKITVQVPAEFRGKSPELLMQALGIEFPELFLASVEKGSPAEAAGLKKGDRLISIDGKGVQTFDQVASLIRSYGQEQKGKDSKLAIDIWRDGAIVNAAVSPNMKERMNSQGREERRFEIGIRPLIIDAAPATQDLVFSNPLSALVRGASQTWKWTSLTVLSFVRLFQNEVSPKNIGGFLSIGQMAKRSWQIGPAQFLNVMAIISINLFILNLLPVPVLDGGHLVFYSIEALRGAPLSMRKMEIAQQVGLVLLLGLMVFALFNDVTRFFN